jgi:hypothetical protein
MRWEQMYTYLLFALSGALVWSIIDRKRRSYSKANYWLRTFVRYFIILNCFSYGINKLFALQMPFPNQSQLATPLGDFLPMRFSWMFIGYSKTYEMFSGLNGSSGRIAFIKQANDHTWTVYGHSRLYQCDDIEPVL